MALFKIEFLPMVISKDLAILPRQDVLRIMDRIESLADDPHPAWSKKLSGRDEYRARAGNCRILYVIETKIKIVLITKVRHRREVYR